MSYYDEITTSTSIDGMIYELWKRGFRVYIGGIPTAYEYVEFYVVSTDGVGRRFLG
jgi:hypothetical protein